MPRTKVAKYEAGKQFKAGFKIAPPPGRKPAEGVLARGNARRLKAKARKNVGY